MLNKPPEYWFTMLGMALYVATRDAERQPIWTRTGKTLISAALALGLSGDFAPLLRDSEALAAVAIMAFGMIVLDLATALIKDRTFIKELIRQRLGGGGNGQS